MEVSSSAKILTAPAPSLKATRDAFGDALLQMGASNIKLVVIDCDLSAPTKTDKFRAAYPDRFFQFGIQEANAIGAAAGLAVSGLKPFVSTENSVIASTDGVKNAVSTVSALRFVFTEIPSKVAPKAPV